MKYNEFEHIVSSERMAKYLTACNGKKKKAQKLYRYNLQLSQKVFSVISCFEVAIRNNINEIMRSKYGDDWLRDAILPGGIFFANKRVEKTEKIIRKAYLKLLKHNNYSPSKLLAEMEFGVWKYMYSNTQYALTGQILLNVFPAKPRSSKLCNYDHTYIFNRLDSINIIRNRIAHHEPICFDAAGKIDTTYALHRYKHMLTLLSWMGINSSNYLHGIDSVKKSTKRVLRLR